MIRDIIEIGRRLSDAKARVGHGNFLPWIEREFGWAERTARRFMEVHEAALKSAKLADLEISVSGLYLLAAPSTPDEARAAVIERAEAGEQLSVADVQKIVDDALTKQAEKNVEEAASAPAGPLSGVDAGRCRSRLDLIQRMAAAAAKPEQEKKRDGARRVRRCPTCCDDDKIGFAVVLA